ncbi:MAG: hypothetical protein H7Y60_10110 [Rhodospirillaceae bacterium]|nr:hypothetical protein [Rhodospirillales bacterium]
MAYEKGERVARGRDDLMSEAGEQLIVLGDLCALFDQGRPYYAKPISVVIRTLVHDGMGKSLISQLGFDQVKFLDTANSFKLSNINFVL